MLFLIRIGDKVNSNFRKNLIKQIVLNVFIIALVLIVFKGTSFSINDNNDNKDLVIQTGNMQVVLNVPNERYTFLDNLKNGVIDEIGKNQGGYNFSITNTGDIPIEYYEIRLVDEENKISTLPHNYLRFTIKKDSEEESFPKNLGDNDSVLYSGYDLLVGNTSTFNLKLWIDEKYNVINNKELYSALGVTLYQKSDIYDKYVLYASDEGENIPFRTSIYSPISSTIPFKDGYNFLGWSTSFKGEIKYQSGDAYQEKKGSTLYAIWEKISED